MPDLGKYATDVLLAYAGSIVVLVAIVVLSLVQAARARRKLDEARLCAALRAAATPLMMMPPLYPEQRRAAAHTVKRQHAFGRTLYEEEDEAKEKSVWNLKLPRRAKKKITIGLPSSADAKYSTARQRRGLTGNTTLTKVGHGWMTSISQ